MKRSIFTNSWVISLFLLLVIGIVIVVVFWGFNENIPSVTIQEIPIPKQAAETPNLNIPDSKPGRLTGSTLDQDGQTYSLVALMIDSATSSTKPCAKTVADSYGRFSLELPSGDYIISATAGDALETVTQEITLLSGTEASTTLFLSREKSIRFLIIDEESRPVSSVIVRLSASLQAFPKKAISIYPSQARLTYQGISDASGMVNLSSLWPGTYYAETQANGYFDHIQPIVTTEKEIYTFVVKKQAILHCSVVDQLNEPVFMAAVELRKTDTGSIAILNKQTSQTGQCEFDKLGRGTYQVSASHPDYTQTEPSKADINLHCDEQNTVLVLSRKGRRVAGSVLTAKEHSPVPNFTVGLYDRVYARGQTPIGISKTNEKGVFQFENILPGLYRIEDISKANVNIEYRVFLPVNGIPVTIEKNDVEGIEILAYPLTSVSGHIYTKKGIPVADAYVGSGHFETPAIRSDKTGFYFVRSLYLFKPEKNGLTVFAFHPDFGWGKSKGVYYAPGDKLENVDVVLGDESGLTIWGTVTGKDGVPLPQANVQSSTFNDFPPQNYPANQQGCYEIKNALTECYLIASVTGYQSEEHLFHCRWDEKGRKEVSFRLTPDSNGTGEISGIVIDANGNPMPFVTVEALLCQASMRYPMDTEKTTTDSQGFFVFKNRKAGRMYQLYATSTKVPFYKKQVNSVYPGGECVVIVLESTPVELKISLDLQEVQSILKQTDGLFVDVLSGNYQVPKLTEFWNAGEFPEKSITLQSADYNSVYVHIVCNKYSIYGRQSFAIGNNQTNPITVNIHLQAEPVEKDIMLVGRCIYPDGKIVKEPYRILCRNRQNQKLLSVQEITAPLDEEGLYTILVKVNSVCELTYLKYDGKIFHRSIFEITPEKTQQWNGLASIRLPDVKCGF